MEELRFWLIAISVIAVFGVYFWEIWSEQRRDSGDKDTAVHERIEPQVVSSPVTSNHSPPLSADMASPEVTPSVPATATDSATAPVVALQDELPFRSIEDMPSEISTISTLPLMTVYIRARSAHCFYGRQIRTAAEKHELCLDENAVFVYLVTSDGLEGQQGGRQEYYPPWYYLANMYEPGTFPRTEEGWAKFTTDGLVFFTNNKKKLCHQDGAVASPLEVYDHMMSVVMRMCSVLEATLHFDRTDEQPADHKMVMAMREQYLADCERYS